MRKNIFHILLLLIFSIQTAFSQNSDHFEGGRFMKRIEFNLTVAGLEEKYNRYNLSGKSIIDRILFGSTNSFVEFVNNGCFESLEDASGFRIIKNSKTNSYQLEIIQMPNVNETYKIVAQLESELTPIIIPSKLERLVPPESRHIFQVYNDELKYSINTHNDEVYKPYRPESKVYNISNELAEKIHSKMSLLIDVFKAEGSPPIVGGGHTITFRCVVGSELWTLTIHVPQERALKLSDICMQIINSYGNSNDESKYLKLLDEIGL